jgi:hypothetical protein
LRTADATFARRLAVLLDAKLEEIVTAFERSEMHLTPPQVDGLLRDVVTKHLNKLERLSAAAKSFPVFDAAKAARDDRRAAWSYRLLHAQGSSAVVRPADEEQMAADGMTATDIAAVQDHLTMLRVNNLVPTRHGILRNLLDATVPRQSRKSRPRSSWVYRIAQLSEWPICCSEPTIYAIKARCPARRGFTGL